jgi:class 3 adenylate cyclase/uncharacterized RDD family membrane protein YckC
MSKPVTDSLTILLTDIEGFTQKTSRKSRADIVHMLDEHKAIVLPVLEARGGRLIKTIGDAFLVVFDSPTDAVLAGVEVQKMLRERNASKQGDDRLDIRIAINSGEVTLADNDVFGEPVNITSRINDIAESGEVFFTEAVYLTMNKTEVPSSEIGLLQLKGIAEKIRVFKVVAETAGRPITVEVVSETLDRPKAPLAGTLQQAPQARRAYALLLDAIFCAFFISLLFREDVFSQFEFDSSMKATAETRTLFYQVVACWVVYGVLSLTVWGATPAKRLLGIRIVRSDGQPIDWRHALARTLFSLVSANFFMIGYAWGCFGKGRLTWHDRIAGTIAVDTRP